MPIEEIARRGPMTLAFGPMRPVGLSIRGPVHGRLQSCNCARTTAPGGSSTWSAFRPR